MVMTTSLSKLNDTTTNASANNNNNNRLLPEYLKRITDDLDCIRRENFLLTSTVLKNNEDIKSIVAKQQRLQQSLKESSADYRKLEKKNLDIEEKLQLNMKEIKLIYDDFEQLKRTVLKLQQKFNQYYGGGGSSSMESTPSSPSSIIGFPLQSSNFNRFDLSPTSTTSTFHQDHNDENVNLKHQINKRIEQIESKLRKLCNQNSDLNEQLERCIRDVHLDEQDLNKKVEQRLQYITDMNQLLQLKLNMLETKFGQHLNQSSEAMMMTGTGTATMSTVIEDPSNHYYQSDNHGYLASKMAYDQISTATLSSAIFSNDKNNINRPTISTTSKQMINKRPTKTIAYVMPNVRILPAHSQQQPLSGTSMIHRSISAGESNNSNNPNDSLSTINNDQTNQDGGDHHSRRCRRHHRIRLFSHRRRH